MFWRPLCTIDTSLWFRWLHSDKIILVLQPDALPRNLLVPSSTGGRYSTLPCRMAASRLFDFLKTWSSFVLIENQSYIRFLPPKETPKYFCIVRVVQKFPCVILHMGYLEGTPHSLQSQTVRSLHVSLKELSISRGERTLAGHGHKRRSTVAQLLRPFATIIDKQLQRVMIR